MGPHSPRRRDQRRPIGGFVSTPPHHPPSAPCPLIAGLGFGPLAHGPVGLRVSLRPTSRLSCGRSAAPFCVSLFCPCSCLCKSPSVWGWSGMGTSVCRLLFQGRGVAGTLTFRKKRVSRKQPAACRDPLGLQVLCWPHGAWIRPAWAQFWHVAPPRPVTWGADMALAKVMRCHGRPMLGQVPSTGSGSVPPVAPALRPRQ